MKMKTMNKLFQRLHYWLWQVLSHFTWVSIEKGCYPDPLETVWLYNPANGALALGCHTYNGQDDGWCWAISNGIIYAENGQIVSECEVDDDYLFTHWRRLPLLPHSPSKPKCNEPVNA